MALSTEKKLLEFRRQYIEWGNILIPYGPSKKSEFRFCYHLPCGTEIHSPFIALDMMIGIYNDEGIDIGADPEPTREMVEEALTRTRTAVLPSC